MTSRYRKAKASKRFAYKKVDDSAKVLERLAPLVDASRCLSEGQFVFFEHLKSEVQSVDEQSHPYIVNNWRTVWSPLQIYWELSEDGCSIEAIEHLYNRLRRSPQQRYVFKVAHGDEPHVLTVLDLVDGHAASISTRRRLLHAQGVFDLYVPVSRVLRRALPVLMAWAAHVFKMEEGGTWTASRAASMSTIEDALTVMAIRLIQELTAYKIPAFPDIYNLEIDTGTECGHVSVDVDIGIGDFLTAFFGFFEDLSFVHLGLGGRDQDVPFQVWHPLTNANLVQEPGVHAFILSFLNRGRSGMGDLQLLLSTLESSPQVIIGSETVRLGRSPGVKDLITMQEVLCEKIRTLKNEVWWLEKRSTMPSARGQSGDASLEGRRSVGWKGLSPPDAGGGTRCPTDSTEDVVRRRTATGVENWPEWKISVKSDVEEFGKLLDNIL